MKTEYGLVQQMIAECIGMGQRKIARSIWYGLGKSCQRRGRNTELISGKRSRLVAVHEKEFAREMTFVASVDIQIGNELILCVFTWRAKGARPGRRILSRRNQKVPVRKLRIQSGECGRRNFGCRGDSSTKQAALALKFLRQRGRGTAVSGVRQGGRKKSGGQTSNRAIQAVALAGPLIRNEEHDLLLYDRSS